MTTVVRHRRLALVAFAVLCTIAAVWIRGAAVAADRARVAQTTEFNWADIEPLLPDENCTFEIDSATGSVNIDTDKNAVPHLDIKPGKCPNDFHVVVGGDDDKDDDDDDDDGGDDDDDDGGNDKSPVASFLVAQPFRVSVLGNGFDVTQVDLGTVNLSRFTPDAPESALSTTTIKPTSFSYGDKGTPFLGQLCGCHTEHGDGKLDLNLVFDGDELIQAFGLVNDPDGSDVKLRIFGRTGPNRGFRIKDCIRIVQPAEQPAVLNDPTVIR